MGTLLVAAALAGCGVPPQAREVARWQAAAAQQAPADDAAVRAALRGQARAWTDFAALLQRRELGGIGQVDAGFVDLTARTAAAARRQVQLMDAGQDDPALNRAVLAEFGQLWSEAQRYLAP